MLILRVPLEHILSIINSLFLHLTPTAPCFHQQRVQQKFLENEYEKVKQLAHFHVHYAKKLLSVDTKIGREKAAYTRASMPIPPEQVHAWELSQLEGGLFTLNMICLIILELAFYQQHHAELQAKIIEYGIHLDSVYRTLQGFLLLFFSW